MAMIKPDKFSSWIGEDEMNDKIRGTDLTVRKLWDKSRIFRLLCVSSLNVEKIKAQPASLIRLYDSEIISIFLRCSKHSENCFL